ncbi:MAG: hypothetical protein DI586_01585 [Micavibrio aeruginosavorus]|uniref:Filamentous haemagglutinin FhaB/tRNA nuclease CdiA-like TPS domain-containing protein n=1 Tax=Micavibrio aeruginosavorus TaxID=349221 RepID=A0A2W5FRL7_9BACT|nr:MAG: hypothetical protein DI586_01585 [Micavibrio aeruginosavorus]
MSHSRRISKQVLFAFLSLSTTLQGMPAYALDPHVLPNGGVVVQGDAQFDYTVPNELHVQQNTDRAVINWNSFNIGENASTQFHQNSSNAIAVNRVVGAGLDPTQIMGTLKANGKIVVLDRNGVIFGRNSQVDVGGIIASTGNIDDDALMNNGQLRITGADTGGMIVNNGNITVSQAGLAAFVSPTAKNNGVINAKLGKVTLAAGDEATVDLYGDGLVELAAGKKLTAALVENTGAINAEGGTVTLTASGAKDIVNTVINTSGVINVSSVTAQGGKIILEGANTQVSGTLDASGKTGGGSVYVGGDYQGKGTIKTANKVNITESAKIKASTTGEAGKGGKVIIWSDHSTNFNGTIEAKGGYISGDGGFVETSGKINLGVTGTVDASSMNGLAGSWLLDPSNVIIVGTGGNAVTGGTNNPVTDDYQVSASSIQSALNSGNNVTITTSNGAGTQDGNITTSGNVSIIKTTGGDATLTLQAHNNIQLENTTISSTNNRLGLNLTADSDNSGGGTITLGNVNFSTLGGDINFNRAVTLTDDNDWNAGNGWIFTGSTVDMGTNDLTITAANMDIGGNIGGTGESILTLRPDHAGADIGVNAGYGFNIDLTEAGYLNPGFKLILGYVGGVGYSNIDGWDLTGKDFDLEVNNSHFAIDNFTQGNGDVLINTTEAYLYGIALGSGDFTVDSRKSGGNNGWINMQENITKSVAGQSTLTLRTEGDIGARDIVSTGGALDVVLWTDTDNTRNDGSFNHQGTITTGGGDIYLVGGLDDGTNGGIAGDGIGDGYMTEGSILWGAHYNAGGGDILIQGRATYGSDNGFYLGNNTSLETVGSGSITIRGITYFDRDAVKINNTTITTENGDITIHGYNPSTMGWGAGLQTSNAQISSVNGDISLTGIRTGATSGTAYGIELYSSNSEIVTQNGNVYVTGTNTVTTNGMNAVAIHSWGDTKIASMTGDLVLTGTSSVTTGTATDWKTDASGDFIIGDAAATGDIILNVDSFDFSNSDTQVITQGSVTIKPRTASTSIGISGGSGAMNLTDAVLAYFDPGTLVIGDSVNGTGDIDVDTWDISSLGYDVELYGNDIDLGGITLADNSFAATARNDGMDAGDVNLSAAISKTGSASSALNLTAGGNIIVPHDITSSSGAIDITLDAGYDLSLTNVTVDTGGGELNLAAAHDVSYTSAQDITVDVVHGETVFLQTSAGKNITARGQISTTGGGDAAVLASGGNFINSYGSSLFSIASGGRWLIYSADPALNTRGGLVPTEDAIFDETYSSLAPSMVPAGSRYIFSTSFVSDPGIMKPPPPPPPPPPAASSKPSSPSKDFENYVVAIDKTRVMNLSVDISQVEISSAPFMLQVQYAPVGATDMVYEDEKVIIKGQ